MVEEASGGNFVIRPYPGGELVPALGVMDAVGNRTVECGQTASYYYYGKYPAFCFDPALPFGMNTRQLNAWLFQRDGPKLNREMSTPRNIAKDRKRAGKE